MENEFEKIIKLVKRDKIQELVDWLKKETDYFEAPASSKFHLNVKGGLLKHSINVYNKFKKLLELHNINYDEETIAITGLFHDLCKCNTYKPNILKNGNLSESIPYKVEDLYPLGHGEKSISILKDFIRLTKEEELIIRWHMGVFDKEFLKYSERIKEVCPEAILFHMADWSCSIFEDDNS